MNVKQTFTLPVKSTFTIQYQLNRTKYFKESSTEWREKKINGIHIKSAENNGELQNDNW